MPWRKSLSANVLFLLKKQGVCCATLCHLTAGMGELGTPVTHEAILDRKGKFCSQITTLTPAGRYVISLPELGCLQRRASSISLYS